MREGEAVHIGGVRWWLSPEARPAAAHKTIAAALAALARGDAPNLRSGSRKQFYALNLAGGAEPDHLLKANAYRPGTGLLRACRASKSRRELRTAMALASRGLPAPVPLAAGERRRFGRLVACYLLIPILRDVTDLRRLWFGGALPPARRRALASAFGAFARRVHDGGLFQDDFAPNNILVTPGPVPGFLLIDFERADLRGRVSRGMQRWMLAKLSRHMDDATATERMRFLVAYAAGDRREAHRWWREIAAFVPRLALRDHRRMRRNAVSEGRHFTRVREEGRTGFARRDADPAALVHAPLPAHPSASAGAPHLRVDGEIVQILYGPLRRRAGREIWARANTLWATGRLVPRPMALLWREGVATLFLAQPAGATPLVAGTEPARARGAVRVLLKRLGSVGEVDPALDAAAVHLASVGRWPHRAVLLAPNFVRFRGRGTRLSQCRAIADRLISGAAGGPSPSR